MIQYHPRSNQSYIDAIPLDEDWVVLGLSEFTDLSLDVYLVRIYPDLVYSYPCHQSKERLRMWLTRLLPGAQLVTEQSSPSWYMVGLARDRSFPELRRYNNWLRVVAVRKIRDGVDPAQALQESVQVVGEPADQESGSRSEGLVIRYVNGQFVMPEGEEEVDEADMDDAPPWAPESDGEADEEEDKENPQE
ncbi:hypothetical protein Slin14017_G097840 [Septoria linicola]|nr:hypothetical protein Slin14017_G097840 [Septoria linicola]